MKEDERPNDAWAASWLDGVAARRHAMSQRKLSSVEAHGGGVERVARLARERGVHLVLLTDDQGVEFVVASLRPFKVVC